jgi:hypothetical protein
MLALESQTEQMFSTKNILITSKCQAHVFAWVQARVVSKEQDETKNEKAQDVQL